MTIISSRSLEVVIEKPRVEYLDGRLGGSFIESFCELLIESFGESFSEFVKRKSQEKQARQSESPQAELL